MNESTRKTMFSSKKQDWETPQDLFDKLNEEFNFNIDVCASDNNHKCDNYFTKETNGLQQEWTGTCWMNPEYDNCAEWIEKAHTESLKGSTVVALIPSRTDTKYFHKHIMNAEEIRFIDGRLKFGDSDKSSKYAAPFPSMLVVFREHNNATPKIVVHNEPHEKKLINPIYHNSINPIRFIK